MTVQEFLETSGPEASSEAPGNTYPETPPGHKTVLRNGKYAQKENRISPKLNSSELSPKAEAISPVKTSPMQQKVPMYKNDVSVDNMVVEIAPNDLIPRKAGNVKVGCTSVQYYIAQTMVIWAANIDPYLFGR